MSGERSLARDPVTGVSELHASSRLGSKPSADDLVDRIRGTRARMTATIDEIEARLAPSQIASEVKRSVRETVDEVREQINPRRMAKRAGDTMLHTIKENPIPALAAGLSIGYLIMKAAESDEHAERRRFERSGYEPYASVPWRGGREDRPWEYDYRSEPLVGYGERGPGSEGEHTIREEASRRAQALRHEMAERGEHMQERLGETAHAASERASDMAHRAQDQARHAGRAVERGARRAERSIEDFVYENPLVAGLISAGLGALVGAAFPPTRKEDEMFGPVRDRVVEQARDVAREKGHQAREVAERVGEEARHHAEELTETAKQEVKSMASHEGSQPSRPETERPIRPTSPPRDIGETRF